jgi:multiple sugar transport system substrate-binding protein
MGIRWLKSIALSVSLAGLSLGCQPSWNLTDSGSKTVTVKLSGWGASPVEKRLLLEVLKDFERSHQV